MSKNKLIAMKRIQRDISEISKNPIKGIGIAQFEDDFMKYIINMVKKHPITVGEAKSKSFNKAIIHFNIRRNIKEMY